MNRLFFLIAILPLLIIGFYYARPLIDTNYAFVTILSFWSVPCTIMFILAETARLFRPEWFETIAQEIERGRRRGQLERLHYAVQDEALARRVVPHRWVLHNQRREQERQAYITRMREEKKAQTRLNARRVYAGSDKIPGNATTVLYRFLGVPERVTRRGGPPSHTARETVAHSGSMNALNRKSGF